MPISPPHQWHESEAWVSIDIKIPNVTSSSADIVTTECYVKVNSAPYFFEADLYGEVDSKLSKASVGFGAIKFLLMKKEQGFWERLSMQGDKKTRLQRRQRSLEAIRKERDKVRKEYPAKFSNLGRVAVGEQLRMEEVKRKIIEARKEAENLMEQENIEVWKEDLAKLSWTHEDNLGPPLLQNLWSTSTSQSSISEGQNTRCEEKNTTQTSASIVGQSVPRDLGTFKNIRDKSRAINQDLPGCMEDFQANDKESFQEKTLGTRSSPATPGSCQSNVGNGIVSTRYTEPILPAPRNCSAVSVTFSPKPDLPKHLPARESRDGEIKLKKSGRASGDALDVSERAPIFLQDKGDKFFKSGDYQSAVNAYTDALEKDLTLVISFANRGACKLHLKEYRACVQDCTSALCLLTKGTPDFEKESILAQNLLVQETMLAQNSLLASEACNPPSTAASDVLTTGHEDTVINHFVNEKPLLRFPIENLELLKCLSGQGCCSMQGLTVEGAGVEEWKLGMKKHMLVRRGVARYHIGDLSKAIDDFAKAVKIKPYNEEVKRLLEDMRVASKVGSE